MKITTINDLRYGFEICDNKTEHLNKLREFISKELSEFNNPVDLVRWVPIEKVQANDYNPNSVAKIELQLLYVSIKNDGYTQPLVTVYDKKKDVYIIVDGFHRYFVMKNNKDIREKNNGHLPVVVLEKKINDRRASTIRHNRARGKHLVDGMSSMVFKMLDNGWSDEEICNELGMEPDEILRLKHITGFAKLFQDLDYSKSWQTKRQLLLKKQYKDGQNGKTNNPTKKS